MRVLGSGPKGEASKGTTLRVRDLASLSAREMEPLLDEESAQWGAELSWEYGEVASAVASGIDRRALIGRVFEEGSRPVAYCYYMSDARRAVIGSIFATASHQGQMLEETLLDEVISEAQADSEHDRVECQTLFSTAKRSGERFAVAGFVSRARHYCVRDLSRSVEVPRHDYVLRPVRREDLGTAARIIHGSHEGTLDAALNATYATLEHCRGFVETLVLRGGCGRFCPEGSFLAEGPSGPAGVLLASHLSSGNGHVCQVSVLPSLQSRGLGTVLVSSTLSAFAALGLETASLSVTRDNTRAYGLYRRLGFTLRKAFAAHAWVRPPGRVSIPTSS